MSTDDIIYLIVSISNYSIGPQMIQLAEGSRAFFVFGDSLVNNGNNNYRYRMLVPTLTLIEFDFLTHRPTGRFSNGLIIPDLISFIDIIIDLTC